VVAQHLDPLVLRQWRLEEMEARYLLDPEPEPDFLTLAEGEAALVVEPA
jgi:hypothetical protein